MSNGLKLGGVLFALTVVLFLVSKKGNKQVFYIENLGANVPTLNPHLMTDCASVRISDDIYEGLAKYSQDGELILTGATKYEKSTDGKTYTFYLRENAKWSNGDKVTANDYVFGYREGVKSGKGYTPLLLCIKNAKEINKGNMDESQLGVYADGDYKLIIELESQNIEFLHYLTITAFFPIHKNNVDPKNNYNISKAKEIICNGPYKVTSWINNEKIEVVKNENYWDKENVSIEKAKFLMISDGMVELNSFKTGQIHMTSMHIPLDNLDKYKTTFGDQYKVIDTLIQERIMFNITNDKFKDKRVRKALTMALDRDTISRDILKLSKPTYTPVPENCYNGNFKDDVNTMENLNWIKLNMEDRIKLAKKLLQEAGYSKKHPLTFEIYYLNTAKCKRCFEAIQYMFKKNLDGLVDCKLKYDDWSTLLANRKKRNFEVINLSWQADYNLPSNFTMLYTTGNTGNASGWSNADVDNLYNLSLKANTFNEYLAIQHLLNTLIAEEYIVIPYLTSKTHKLVSDKIVGFKHEKNILHRYSTKDLKFKN